MMQSLLKKKEELPEQLRICISATKFPLQTRSSDTGLLWPMARGLTRLGHEVVVISTSSPLKKPDILRHGVQVYYVFDEPGKVSSNFQMAAYQKFKKLHAEKPFHLVHSLDRSALLIAENKESLNVAIAYDVDATRMAQIFATLGQQQDTLGSLLKTYAKLTYRFLSSFFGGDRQLLQSADGVFVTTPQQKEMLERYYLYPEIRTHNVPYGIELMDLTPREKNLELKKKWNLPENAKVAMTMVDMVDSQEIIPLLKAVEKVVIRMPQAYLFLLGHGPSFKKVEFEVLNMALGSHVIMPGPLMQEGDLEEAITLADVFINLGSRSSGYEPATLEAMAQKKLVIGSEVAPVAHIIDDGLDGFLVRPADSESIGNILIEIFSGKMPTEEIGDRARQKIVDLFNSKKMTDLVIESYQNILLNSGRYHK